jgi:hypothetical protein
MFDNMAVLSFLAGTLMGGFNFPAGVYTRMFQEPLWGCASEPFYMDGFQTF